MRRRHRAAAFVLALGFAALFADPAAALQVGDKAPEFTLTGPGNKPVLPQFEAAGATVYFIDRQGRLIGRTVGPRGWESPAARAFIEALLAQP